jgi:hypothetical protein
MIDTDSSPPSVQIEIVELDTAGRRQIKPRQRLTARLSERRDEILAAVAEVTGLVLSSGRQLRSDDDNWRVGSVEATFGLTLTAEAGVVLSKASAGASLEVTVRIDRA